MNKRHRSFGEKRESLITMIDLIVLRIIYYLFFHLLSGFLIVLLRVFYNCLNNLTIYLYYIVYFYFYK